MSAPWQQLRNKFRRELVCGMALDSKAQLLQNAGKRHQSQRRGDREGEEACRRQRLTRQGRAKLGRCDCIGVPSATGLKGWHSMAEGGDGFGAVGFQTEWGHTEPWLTAEA